MGGHEVFQPPILFRVAKGELQLEPQAIRVDQLVGWERQITTEHQDMRLGVRFQIGLDNAHHIKQLGEGLVSRLELINAGFDVLLDAGLAQIALGNAARLELVAVDALGATPGVWAVIGLIQGTVRAQFTNQVQLARTRHLERSGGAKVAVQHQIGQWQHPADASEQRQYQRLDACELRREFRSGCGVGAGAFGTTQLAFGGWFGGFGSLGGFLLHAAHDLFERDRKGAALFGTDQREGEEGQTWYRLAIQRGKEAVETGGVLAGFGHDGFIASQQIVIIRVEEMRAKKQPQEIGPGDDGREKALHSAIAAARSAPARDAEHGDATGHGEQGWHDARELTNSGQGDLRLETQQEW